MREMLVVPSPATHDQTVTQRMVTQDRTTADQNPIHRDGTQSAGPRDYTVFIPAISPSPLRPPRPPDPLAPPACRCAGAGHERGAYLRSRRCSELR